MNKKRILFFLLILTLVLALSLSTTTAKTVNKKFSIETWELDSGTNDFSYIKITKGKTFMNGKVYGTNPMTMGKQMAPVYACNYRITAKKNVKITKVVATSIGYPSGKTYKKTHYFSNSKLLKPDKYKAFWKFTVYYTVKV